MTKITASTLPPLSEVSPQCVKYYKPLAKKKKKAIDLDEIGTPRYNLLLDLMKCQVKHPNNSTSGDNEEKTIDVKPCVKVEKAYNSCHAGIMGVGNFKGRKNCGKEIESLFVCVNPNASLPQAKINSMKSSQEGGDNDFLASPEMDVAKKTKDHPSINDYYRALAVGDKPIKYQHGLSNYSNVQFGDDRVIFNKSMSQVMYQLNEEQANQMTIHDNSQNKTKKQRMQDYEEANGVVGPEKIQEMEQMMRDKLQQRTKAGPFQLRKTFKYFDRDGSGGIDFSEFQRAMELMGFQFTDMQQLALFARYDESYSGEVDYSEFVQKVMESDFKGVSNASKKALNTLVSSTFMNNDSGSSALEGDDDSDLDENELDTFRRAEVGRLFSMVDRDGSGLIDEFEFSQLLENLGRKLPHEDIHEGFSRIDTDASGHIDFEEFYAWAYPKK